MRETAVSLLSSYLPRPCSVLRGYGWLQTLELVEREDMASRYYFQVHHRLVCVTDPTFMPPEDCEYQCTDFCRNLSVVVSQKRARIVDPSVLEIADAIGDATVFPAERFRTSDDPIVQQHLVDVFRNIRAKAGWRNANKGGCMQRGLVYRLFKDAVAYPNG